MNSYHRNLLAGYIFFRRQGFLHSERAILDLLETEHGLPQSFDTIGRYGKNGVTRFGTRMRIHADQK